MLIETGVIDTGDDDAGGSLAAAPLTRPASQSDGKGLTVNEIYDRASKGVAFIRAQMTERSSPPSASSRRSSRAPQPAPAS